MVVFNVFLKTQKQILITKLTILSSYFAQIEKKFQPSDKRSASFSFLILPAI